MIVKSFAGPGSFRRHLGAVADAIRERDRVIRTVLGAEWEALAN